MSIKKLIDSMAENWPAKVVCFILAILFYIFNKTSTLQEKTFTIPLNVEAKGLMMPANELPKYVKVVVTATKDDISSVKESDFSAKVNLNDFVEAGEYSVPVVVSVSEKLELLETFQCKPKTESVNVLLDEKILKYIPVAVAESGSPAYGYTVSSYDISPATVKVVGPSRIVEKTKRIYTKKLIIDGAATSFSKELKLDNFNSRLTVLPESDFKVTVTVVPGEETRKIEKVVPVAENLAEDLVASGYESGITLSVSGTILTLDTFKSGDKTVTLDLSEITEPGVYEIPVSVSLPAGITLSQVSAEKISVAVSKKVVEEEVSQENSEKTATENTDKGEKTEKNEKSEKGEKSEKSAKTEKVDAAQ